MPILKDSYMSDGIWITWENQRRNKGIAESLGWKLYVIDVHASPIIRYIISILKTVVVILKEKPISVAVQNPSIILAVCVAILSPVMGYVFIMDAHNGGLRPLEGSSKILLIVARWLQKKADITIVTNSILKSHVDALGGRAISLPDKLPVVPEVQASKLDAAFSVAFICTFSIDEPFQEVFAAARLVSPTTMIYTTGKFQGKINSDDVPSNIRLLGFVSEKTYWELLIASDVIMDLTTRENCLVCGAYEGVSLSKPLILSNTSATRSYFTKGCVYVDSNASSIAKGIQIAQEKQAVLKKEIQDLKKEIEKGWEQSFLHLKSSIENRLKHGFI